MFSVGKNKLVLRVRYTLLRPQEQPVRVLSAESGPKRAWSPRSRLRARNLLAMEDGVVNVWPELPEHNGHSIERGI